MRQKVYLFTLFLLSVLWTGMMIAIGSILPLSWDWGRSAVAVYALGIMVASFIRYHKCDEHQVASRYVSEKETIRIIDIALSAVFFFMMAFLPYPWTLGNYIMIVLAGGVWLAFLREDIKISRRRKKPSLYEMTGPLPLISKK